MRDFCQTYNLLYILEVKEDKTNPEEITEDHQLKLNLEDLKTKYQRDNRELYHEAIKHNHRKMSDSGKLGSLNSNCAQSPPLIAYSEAPNEPRLTKMDPSGSIFSSSKVEKWDRAEVKDLTDYLTVKESTTENTVKIWPSLLTSNES